jgi:single-strand DNA-binding protein
MKRGKRQPSYCGPSRTGPTKRLRHNGLLVTHKPTLAGLIPFPFGFHILPALFVCCLFARFFFREKKYGKQAELVKVRHQNKNIMNIIGRITRDARVSTLSGGKQVVNFSVATNNRYRNKQGEQVEPTTYFDCAYWISPNVAKVLTKGTLVELTGRVSARAWTSSDGQPQAALNFHTSGIKFHGGGRRTEEHSPGGAASRSKKARKDDLPF